MSTDDFGQTPTATAEPPRRRADAERNAAHILDAAAEVIRRQPMASIAEIAIASGLGRATIYRHFATREELLVALGRQCMRETTEAILSSRPEEGTATEAVWRMIHATLALEGTCGVLMGLDIPKLPEEDAALMEPVIRTIVRGMQSGEFRPDLDLAWTGQVIGSLYQLSMTTILSGERTREEAARLFGESLLGGIASR